MEKRLRATAERVKALESALIVFFVDVCPYINLMLRRIVIYFSQKTFSASDGNKHEKIKCWSPAFIAVCFLLQFHVVVMKHKEQKRDNTIESLGDFKK